jgi:hypothetical protein
MEDQKKYFDNYFTKQLSYPSNQVDATIAFFEKRGFASESAKTVAAVLLKQAKIDGVKIFELLDTLGSVDSPVLSKVVLEVINANGQRTSELGVKTDTKINTTESRNIVV